MNDFKKVAVKLYELVLKEHAILAVGAMTGSKDIVKCFAEASVKVNDFLVDHDGEFKKARLEVEANEMLNDEVE